MTLHPAMKCTLLAVVCNMVHKVWDITAASQTVSLIAAVL